MKKLLFASAALASFIAAVPAQAATLNWTLSGVTFNDGGTASGTFSTDSTTGGVLSFNVATTAGAIQTTGFTYDAATSFLFANNYFSPNSFILANNTVTRYINLRFVNALTAGGTNALIPGAPISGSWECSNCGSIRKVTGGFATTLGGVPEPTIWGLLVLGFGAIGFGMRSRRRAPTVSYA